MSGMFHDLSLTVAWEPDTWQGVEFTWTLNQNLHFNKILKVIMLTTQRALSSSYLYPASLRVESGAQQGGVRLRACAQELAGNTRPGLAQ